MISDLLPTAILIPSLNRPHNLRDVVASIHDNTPEEHFILFCVSDEDSMNVLDELGEWYLDDSDSDDRRYVTRMNKLVIDHLDDARTIFFGSDDVLHRPGWLASALDVMDQGPSCVVVNDTHNPNGTQAVIRREYLQKAVFDDPTVAFHPGYLHNFADTEMFLTAHLQGEFARALDSIVEHLHPYFGSVGRKGWDTTYADAQSGWDHDAQLWEMRSSMIRERFS